MDSTHHYEMGLKEHRQNRHLLGARETPCVPNLQLKRRLLYKYVRMAWIVKEGDKSRLQFLRGIILSTRKPKTEYLTVFYQRGARRVGAKGYLSLKNTNLAFIETPSGILL